MTIWKNIVQPDRQQTTIWPRRIACWITKATHTDSVYVILIPFPTATLVARTRLNVSHTYIACLVAVLTEPLHILTQRFIAQTQIRIVCRMKTGQSSRKEHDCTIKCVKMILCIALAEFPGDKPATQFLPRLCGKSKALCITRRKKRGHSEKKRGVVLPCLLLLIPRAACTERVQYTPLLLRTLGSPYGHLGSIVRA